MRKSPDCYSNSYMDSDNDSQENTSSPAEERVKKLEMNRAAAMRSRLKKKQEIERLRGVVAKLREEQDLLVVKTEQYEKLLQQAYRDNALMKNHLSQVETDTQLLLSQLSPP